MVSIDEGEKIETGKTTQEKNRTLMTLLFRKHEQGYIEFLTALRKDSVYADLADEIERTAVTSRDMSTLQTCYK